MFEMFRDISYIEFKRNPFLPHFFFFSTTLCVQKKYSYTLWEKNSILPCPDLGSGSFFYFWIFRANLSICRKFHRNQSTRLIKLYQIFGLKVIIILVIKRTKDGQFTQISFVHLIVCLATDCVHEQLCNEADEKWSKTIQLKNPWSMIVSVVACVTQMMLSDDNKVMHWWSWSHLRSQYQTYIICPVVWILCQETKSSCIEAHSLQNH